MRILKHLERGRFGRNLGLTFGQVMVESGLLTVAVLVVARLFGAELFGRLGLYLTGVQFVTMVLDGLVAAVLKRTAESQNRNAKLLPTAFRMLALVLLITAPLALATLGVVKLSNPTLAWPALALALLVALTRGTKMTLEAVARGVNNFSTPAWCGIVTALPYAALLIAVARAGHRIEAYLLITVVYQAANTLLLLASLWRTDSRGEEGPADVSGVVGYAAPLMLRGAIGYLYLRVNTPLIAMFVIDAAELGYFRLAEQVLTIPLIVLGAILTPFAPRVAEHWKRGERDQLAHLTARVYGVITALMVCLAAVFLASHIPISFWFPAYATTAKMLQAYSIVLVLQGLAYAASVLLVQTQYAGTATWLSALAGAINIAFVFVALKLGHGALGAVVATAIAHTLISILVVVIAHRKVGLPFRIRL